jgi:hypothetical protein
MNQSQLGLAEGVRLSTRPDGTDESIMHRPNSSNRWCWRSREALVRPPMYEGLQPISQPLGGLFETWRAIKSQNPAPPMHCRRLGGAMPLGSFDGEQRRYMSTNFSQLWGYVEEVPRSKLKKLLDSSVCISPGKLLESIFFAARLHKSDSSFSLTHHDRPPELGTLYFVCPLSRGHVDEVVPC